MNSLAYISDGYGDEGFQPVYLVPPTWYPYPAPGWRATSNPAGDS